MYFNNYLLDTVNNPLSTSIDKLETLYTEFSKLCQIVDYVSCVFGNYMFVMLSTNVPLLVLVSYIIMTSYDGNPWYQVINLESMLMFSLSSFLLLIAAPTQIFDEVDRD